MAKQLRWLTGRLQEGAGTGDRVRMGVMEFLKLGMGLGPAPGTAARMDGGLCEARG